MSMTDAQFREFLAKTSKSTQQLNSHLVAPKSSSQLAVETKHLRAAILESTTMQPDVERLRSAMIREKEFGHWAEANLNKTEARYLQWLRNQQPLRIGIQNMTLHLYKKCTYTPDFWVHDEHGKRAIDVKANWGDGKPHVEDDAMVKIKAAAALFPEYRFLLAWPVGEVWHHREITP